MSSPADLSSASIGLVGFGEVGSIFGGALVRGGAKDVFAWDRAFADPARAEEMRTRVADGRVVDREGMAALLAASDWVFSAVTADQTLAVAREAAPLLRRGTVFVDLNSASPKTKSECARLVNEAGARYVEAAVMTSVPPYGLAVPMLLGGPHAHDVEPTLRGWGLDATAADERYGIASAIKMCRSVIVKGMEALVVESFSAARAYGVEDRVLASLAETFPGLDWEKQGDYFFERVIRHGRRRADEMVEAAATMDECGVGGTMALAASQRQAGVTELAREGAFAEVPKDWRSRADAAVRRRR